MILSCHMWLMYFVFLHARVKKILTHAALCVAFKDITLVQFSCSIVSDSLWAHGLQHARLPCPSLFPSWSLLTFMSIELVILSSHLILCYCLLLLPFPASGSFQMSQFFASGGQSIGVSASTSVLPMNIQDWFPLGWTDWISWQSKGFSRVFSSTTIWKHRFFSTQLYLWSNSHIHTWLLEKP